MATQYSKITPTVYNNARTQVVGVLGVTTTGEVGATQGYGQVPASSAVSQHEKITESQLDNLRVDIVKAHTHQNGVAPTITNVSVGNTELASLFTEYQTLAASINTNRNSVAANQLAQVTYTQTETYAAYTGTVGTGGGWKNYANYELAVTFATANDARYFFNTGSSFNFAASRSGGTLAPSIGLDQNTSWTTLLQSVTSDNPTFARTNFYELTSSYAVFYNKNSTGTYAANYYRISVKSDVADNTYGGATVVTFKIEFVDAYNDGNTTNYDGVDGTFTNTVIRKMPKGVGLGGALAVTAPTSVAATPSTGFTENGTPIYITAAYSIAITPSTVTEASALVNMEFTATNYNVPNIVTWTITATSTTGLNDFVQVGWLEGTNIDGFKTLTRSVTTIGTYSSSTAATLITTNPDTTTEGTETFTISAVGSADGSGGGFVSNIETLTVTDSSKTATPGYSVSEPTASPQLSCIPGEGLGTTETWYITSVALTGNAALVIYGIYLDISANANINSYQMTLWDGTVITESSSSYYTLPSPRSVSNGTFVSFTIRVGSTSGSAGTGSVRIRFRSNAGSVDGSGPNIIGPSYNQASAIVSVQLIVPTVVLSISASPSSVSYTYVAGGSGSASTTVTVTNSGNARATLSNYNVSSPGGTVSAGSISGLILAGGTKSTSVTYSSNFAYNGTSNISITGDNSLIGTTSASRNVSVTATQAFGIISQSFASYSEFSSVVYASRPFAINITNVGLAPLTVTDITFSGVSIFSFMTVTPQFVTFPQTIAAGGSRAFVYQWNRTRIGSSTVVASITSDTGGNAGTVTSLSTTFTGTATVPTFTLSGSGPGAVTGNSWTSNNGVLPKDGKIQLSFAGLEPNALQMVAMFWTEDQNYSSQGGKGIWATNTNTDPKTIPITALTSSTGTIEAWPGTDPIETRYWRAGRNRFYVQLPIGKTDAGVQQWYTNSRSGTSACSSWSTSATFPEAPCGANQTWIGFTVIPNITWSFSTYEPVQGDNVTYTLSGAASNVTVVTAPSSFTVDNGTTTLYPWSPPSIITDANGGYSGTFNTGPSGPFGPQQAASVGTYNSVRPISPDGWGGTFFSNGAFRTFDVLSPAFYLVPDTALDPAWGVGSAASNSTTSAASPRGTFAYYRRVPGTNGTYTTINVIAASDDGVEVYCQGNYIGSGGISGPTSHPNKTVVVSDGYSHWKFIYTNTGGPGWFAVAVYVGPTLYFALSNPGYIQNPSKW